MEIELPTPTDLATQMLQDYTAPQLEEFLQAFGEALWIAGGGDDDSIKGSSSEAMLEAAKSVFDAKAAWAARPILGTVRTA